MKTHSIVPQGTVINGRLIGEHIKVGPYHKYYWSCPVHGVTSENPMRIKDMRIRVGPRCCYVVAGEFNPNWRGCGILSAKKFNQIRSGASARRKKSGGLDFNLTPEYLIRIWTEQRGRCAYSYRDLVDINSSAASLDRICSAEGYVEGNVEWVHKDVNLAKQQLSRLDFVSLCKEVSRHLL